MYRAQAFLPDFIQRAVQLLHEVQAAGYSIELILIANDITPQERDLIKPLVRENDTARLVEVERETLYASWNRGVNLASGQAIGFWNVDDRRTTQGITAGIERIREGCPLVYFDWILLESRRWLGLIDVPHRVVYPALPFDRHTFARSMKCGSFFLFTRALYDEIGPFDERFRICGDTEWCFRAAKAAELCPCHAMAGYFVSHSENLSTVGSARWMENNVYHLIHGNYDLLLPADPAAMQALWSKWADEITLPADIEDQLWGEDAEARWHSWRADYNRWKRRRFLSESWRMLPRLFIDKTGLRSLFYRLGIVKSPLPYT